MADTRTTPTDQNTFQSLPAVRRSVFRPEHQPCDDRRHVSPGRIISRARHHRETLNPNGIPNNGTDEANHFIQMAGPWMRPGYCCPCTTWRRARRSDTAAQLSQFAVDFSNRIHEVMGFRPVVYSARTTLITSIRRCREVYPHLWIARWPQGSGQLFTGNLQTDNPPPSPSTANVYGEWNPEPHRCESLSERPPWKFWQYSSGERLQSFNNGNSNLDGDVANGGTEFLKDHLVPALWVSDSSGDWNDLSKWNSGQTPVAPPGDPSVEHCGTCPVGTTGQLSPIGDANAAHTPLAWSRGHGSGVGPERYGHSRSPAKQISR